MGKSKRNSGPKNDNRRKELLEQRQAERESLESAPTRPFEGLAFECDLVAMREFVASATAPLPVTDANGRAFTVATVLPGAVAALVRENDDDISAFIALQVQQQSADLAADIGASTSWARSADPGQSLQAATPSADSARLIDVVDASARLDITVFNDFDWWIPQGTTPDADVAATIERANSAIMPSARIDGVDAAWWVDAGEKAHIRWVRPEDEEALMVAIARLQAAGALDLGEGSRFAGSFRTHGLLVPVFDLDPEVHPAEWSTGTVELGKRLDEVLADTSPLTTEQRRARDGLRSRQVTLR